MALAYRLKWWLGTSRAGTVVDFTNFLFSAVYCINYIAETCVGTAHVSMHCVQPWICMHGTPPCVA